MLKCTQTLTHSHTGPIQGGVTLKTGSMITVSTDEKFKDCGDANCIYVNYKNIVKIMDTGDRIFVDDGLLSLKVKEKGETHLITG